MMYVLAGRTGEDTEPGSRGKILEAHRSPLGYITNESVKEFRSPLH